MAFSGYFFDTTLSTFVYAKPTFLWYTLVRVWKEVGLAGWIKSFLSFHFNSRMDGVSTSTTNHCRLDLVSGRMTEIPVGFAARGGCLPYSCESGMCAVVGLLRTGILGVSTVHARASKKDKY